MNTINQSQGWFQSTESLVKKYFKDVARCESLANKENLLEEQIRILTSEMRLLKEVNAYSSNCRMVPFKCHTG